MKTIVISAVNLRKGGTLTILRQCLAYLSEASPLYNWRIIALVHKKELALYSNIDYIEFPHSCKSWLARLRSEHFEMQKIASDLESIDLWFSLHDTTPTVTVKNRAVYFHNPFPFFTWKWRHLWQNPSIVAFSLFTRWLIYGINIEKNKNIIVQQDWIREAIARMFRLNKSKIIVSPPITHHDRIEKKEKTNTIYHFMFAAYHDIHKNFECLCEAAKLLEEEVGEKQFKVTLTIARNDNKYTSWLNKKWGSVSSISFAGFQTKEQLYDLYRQSDCLVFPSLVETWGLPISEYAVSGKPMLLADLPYAHETAAGSPLVSFFNPHRPKDLKELMKRLINGDQTFLRPVEQKEIAPPCTNSWKEIFDILLAE